MLMQGLFFMGQMKRIYKGWVPTVSGRLSFDVIGTGSHPNPPVCANIEDRSTRYVLCRQPRILLDNAIIFREKAALHLYKEVGKFQFICVGKSSNDPKDMEADLTGFVYIYDEDVWNAAIHREFEKSQKILLSYLQVSSSKSITSYFIKEYETIRELLAKHCYFYVPFVLNRNGVTQLTVTDDCASNPSAPSITEDPDDHVEHSVCSQSFFFLKDILHNHQHHDPYTDTLSDIYLVKNDEDEYRWRCPPCQNSCRLNSSPVNCGRRRQSHGSILTRIQTTGSCPATAAGEFSNRSGVTRDWSFGGHPGALEVGSSCDA
ncbi:hypothetical protein [Citrifermentans bremense]|uniref:hypothetical protein n=1 Tax=Citrifermentans bremense TaxID=60035 RepID=UPI001CF7D47D|nr:hypothetical protein [Citrifermentans bremense]